LVKGSRGSEAISNWLRCSSEYSMG